MKKCENKILHELQEKLFNYNHVETRAKDEINKIISLHTDGILKNNDFHKIRNKKHELVANISGNPLPLNPNSEFPMLTRPIITAYPDRFGNLKLERAYNKFKVGDRLLLWQTLNINGIPQHLAASVLSDNKHYSFGFGLEEEEYDITNVKGAPGKALRYAINELGDARVRENLKGSKGKLYTPDFIFEEKLYKQIINGGSYLKLIVNTFLTQKHLDNLKTQLKDIKINDMTTMVSATIIPDMFIQEPSAYLYKMLQIPGFVETAVGHDLFEKTAEERGRIIFQMYNFFHIKELMYCSFASKTTLKKTDTLFQDLIKRAKKLYDIDKRTILDIINDNSLETVSQLPTDIFPEKYQIELRSESDPIDLSTTKLLILHEIGQQTKVVSNCASFLTRIFGDVITCYGESIIVAPQFCHQKFGTPTKKCNTRSYSSSVKARAEAESIYTPRSVYSPKSVHTPKSKNRSGSGRIRSRSGSLRSGSGRVRSGSGSIRSRKASIRSGSGSIRSRKASIRSRSGSIRSRKASIRSRSSASIERKSSPARKSSSN